MSNIRSIQKHIIEVKSEDAIKSYCQNALENLLMSAKANPINGFMGDLNTFNTNLQTASYGGRLKTLFTIGHAQTMLCSANFLFVKEYFAKKASGEIDAKEELEIYVLDDNGTVIEIVPENSIKI